VDETKAAQNSNADKQPEFNSEYDPSLDWNSWDNAKWDWLRHMEEALHAVGQIFIITHDGGFAQRDLARSLVDKLAIAVAQDDEQWIEKFFFRVVQDTGVQFVGLEFALEEKAGLASKWLPSIDAAVLNAMKEGDKSISALAGDMLLGLLRRAIPAQDLNTVLMAFRAVEIEHWKGAVQASTAYQTWLKAGIKEELQACQRTVSEIKNRLDKHLGGDDTHPSEAVAG
jgi:hypothetical protein